jgi:hypothetical protein
VGEEPDSADSTRQIETIRRMMARVDWLIARRREVDAWIDAQQTPGVGAF